MSFVGSYLRALAARESSMRIDVVAERLFQAGEADAAAFDIPLEEGVDPATTLARRLDEGGVDARVLAPRSSPDGVALVLAEERTVLAVSARGRAVVIGSMDGAGALSPSP